MAAPGRKHRDKRAANIRLREAFAATPRQWFLPRDQVPYAAHDTALPIGYGQTNSQPTTVANMLLLLDVQPGQHILDLGSGSGWTTGLLAWLTGPDGRVIGVERVPELVAAGSAALAKCQAPWADIRQAKDGVLGWPEDGPFDRILVSAMASDLAHELLAQLAIGGILVCPVRGDMLRVVHTGPDAFDTTRHGRYVFVPLITDHTEGR